MTEKELLYIEDTINHILQITKLCDTYQMELEDKKLEKFMQTINDQYNNIYKEIYSLLK